MKVRELIEPNASSSQERFNILILLINRIGAITIITKISLAISLLNL